MNKSKKKQQLDMQTLKRLLSYLKQYKARFVFVLICILVSAGASVLAALFLETLIDDYITPLLVQAAVSYTHLAFAIILTRVKIMVNVSAYRISVYLFSCCNSSYPSGVHSNSA